MRKARFRCLYSCCGTIFWCCSKFEHEESSYTLLVRGLVFTGYMVLHSLQKLQLTSKKTIWVLVAFEALRYAIYLELVGSDASKAVGTTVDRTAITMRSSIAV